MTLDLAIPDLAAAHGRFLSALRDESELCLRQFAAATLPDLVKAVGPESEGQGKGAIIADIFKVVIPVKPQHEKRVLINPAPVRHLMSRRRHRGRVNRAAQAKHYVRRADFQSYRDAKFRNIGIAASGYAAAARQLGVELPAWMADQREGEGDFTLERRPDGTTLVVANQVEWAYWLPEAMSRSGYAVQSQSGKFYELAVQAWDRAKGGS